MPEDGATKKEDSTAAEAEAPPEAPKELPGLDLKALVDGEYTGAILEHTAFDFRETETTFIIRLDALLDVAGFLRDHPSARFALLNDLTAAHYPDEEEPLQVIYHLYSFEHNRRLRLKVKVRGGAEVSTVSGLWSSANWMEREVFDLFGIRFSGHPDLRRIMLPEDWGSHPFLKDYPLEGRREYVYAKPVRKEIGE